MRVVFGEPDAGWLPVSIFCDAGNLSFDASHIYPSLETLITSLHALLVANETRSVIWNTEPTEYEFQFARNTESITLAVWEYADIRRTQSDGDLLLTEVASYRQIALPFWRALRGLQGQYNAAEWRWRREFPVKSLEQWTLSLQEQGLIA
jgi:hypothetical protein